MAPDLTDLLGELLLAPRRNADAADDAWQRFLAFVQGRGIDYCNFAAFDFDAQERATASMMVSNMDPAWIEEYLDRRMDARDYVALRRPPEAGGFDCFAFGDWLVPRLDEVTEVSAPVLRGAADAGMADALAIIGRAPTAPGAETSRYVGFGLGGGAGSAAHALAQRNELLVAAYALINAMRPRIDAALDGFDRALTPREQQILALFAQGLRRDRIAHRLGISHQMVDLHGASLRRKLKAQTVAEAVAKAFRYGLL
jgi:DNA-binding CsgD family transcriptional regulator